jgi:voltage-gated potassium channel
LNPHEDLVEDVQGMGIPVIQDDASRQSALIAAGIERAQAIILCTQNDSLNLQIAFKARKINRDLHAVLRIFDNEFAQMVREEFGFTAMSATEMAAPTFATAAARVDIMPPITVEGEAFSLAKFDIKLRSRLVGLSVGDIEQEFDVSVVLLRQNESSDFHPAGDCVLQAGNVLAVLGGIAQISALSELN